MLSSILIFSLSLVLCSVVIAAGIIILILQRNKDVLSQLATYVTYPMSITQYKEYDLDGAGCILAHAENHCVKVRYHLHCTDHPPYTVEQITVCIRGKRGYSEFVFHDEQLHTVRTAGSSTAKTDADLSDAEIEWCHTIRDNVRRACEEHQVEA